MLGKVLSWLTSGGISAIGEQINRAYEIRENAKSDAARLEADKRINLMLAQQNILIAEQKSWMTRWIRPAIAAPFAIFIWKVVVWDKVLGWGVTDPLSEQFAEIMMIVLGAYFIARPFEKWIRK